MSLGGFLDGMHKKKREGEEEKGKRRRGRGLIDYTSGNHIKPGFIPLGNFGDAILRTVIPPVSEAATNILAQEMLQICNCDPLHMFAFRQRGQFEVMVWGRGGEISLY
jgi:hypothetical protein